MAATALTFTMTDIYTVASLMQRSRSRLDCRCQELAVLDLLYPQFGFATRYMGMPTTQLLSKPGSEHRSGQGCTVIYGVS
jgi:hypothetical protein